MNKSFILAALLLVAGCGSSPKEESAPVAVGWKQEIALKVEAKLGGCASGELDPGNPGDEIAVVASNGDVYLITRKEGVWSHETIATLPGEMIQCAVADIDKDHVGDELVVVGAAQGGEESGGPGAAWLLKKTAGAWDKVLLLKDDALLHAVALGDVDRQREGNEIFLAGYGPSAHLVTLDGETVSHRTLAPLAGQAKGATILSDGTVYVACADGGLRRLRGSTGTFTSELVQQFPAPLARIGTDGLRVLFSSNDGTLRLYEGLEIKTVYSEKDRLRGAVFAAVDPRAREIQLATAGYSGAVTLLKPEGNGFLPETVGHDEDKFHHLTFANIEGIGPCLVGCGYSGRVTVIAYR